MNKIIKNFSYTLVSNIIAFAISALVTFIVPKVLGVENYSYFQLYLFYVNYTGFLHFGWADGIYLRYGGCYYDELNKEKFSGQFKAYCFVECIISIIIIIASLFFDVSVDKQFIFIMIAISIPLHLPKTFLQYVLQGTNRIKEYSRLTIIDRSIYIVLVLSIVLLRIDDYKGIVIADLIGKTGSLVYALYQCREIIFSKSERIIIVVKEIWENISVGIKLMVANIASMLIIGIVRLGIENQWDVITFGKVSLTMSISNLLMIFIRAVATIMFPLLRRIDTEKMLDIYKAIRACIMPLLLGMLVFYYPVKVVMSAWLPQYAESLNYMALLFPMCVYESKMSMLVETYLKTLRKEKILLVVNVLAVILSAIFTGISAYNMHNLDVTVCSILLLLMIRCVLAEVVLSRIMKINVVTDILLEIILTVTFVWSSWYLKGVFGVGIYAITFVIYLIIKHKDIINVRKILKSI